MSLLGRTALDSRMPAARRGATRAVLRLGIAMLLLAPGGSFDPPAHADSGSSTPPALRIGTRLAGLLVLDATHLGAWPPARTWRYPVGDSADFGRPTPEGPGYVVNRGLEARAGRAGPHQGVDLCNRRAGGTVVAAAAGLVVAAAGDSTGYGVCAVISHRLEDGRVAYSVYSHLAQGSLALRPGQMVAPGARVGRVGRTGRASTDHLHFEIRLADDPDRRWEKSTAVDPLAFIAERLRSAPSDGPAAGSEPLEH